MKRDRNGKVSDRDGERTRWIREYRASGLGLRRFAQQHGLKPGRLHYWVYQSPKPSLAKEALPTFQEVRLPASALASSLWNAEIGLPSGTTVRLAQATDLTWAIALIDSLRRPCSSR